MDNSSSVFFIAKVTVARRTVYSDRVCTGHGKPGKSWNFINIPFSRPGKLKLMCESWKVLEKQ